MLTSFHLKVQEFVISLQSIIFLFHSARKKRVLNSWKIISSFKGSQYAFLFLPNPPSPLLFSYISCNVVWGFVGMSYLCSFMCISISICDISPLPIEETVARSGSCKGILSLWAGERFSHRLLLEYYSTILFLEIMGFFPCSLAISIGRNSLSQVQNLFYDLMNFLSLLCFKPYLLSSVKQ